MVDVSFSVGLTGRAVVDTEEQTIAATVTNAYKVRATHNPLKTKDDAFNVSTQPLLNFRDHGSFSPETRHFTLHVVHTLVQMYM